MFLLKCFRIPFSFTCRFNCMRKFFLALPVINGMSDIQLLIIKRTTHAIVLGCIMLSSSLKVVSVKSKLWKIWSRFVYDKSTTTFELLQLEVVGFEGIYSGILFILRNWALSAETEHCVCSRWKTVWAPQARMALGCVRDHRENPLWNNICTI